EHARLRLEAINRLREGKPGLAAELLAEADRASPPVSGALNGDLFTALRDLDDLFGTVLEVFAKGKYYWVPLEQIDVLVMNKTRFPRDLLWYPARIETRGGPKGEVFLPVLYPDSHEHPRNEIKLGRETDWKPIENGKVLGLGRRDFLVDDQTVSILEWRQLEV